MPDPTATDAEKNDGVQGLFDLYMNDWTHPAFKTGKEAASSIESSISDEYRMKTKIGVLTEPPREENLGVLKFEDGTEVDMSSVRYCSIIGADELSFLQRGEHEIYIHRPVRVWWNEAWHIGRIRNAGVHGLVGVYCDEKVSDSEYMDGHGLTIHRDSFDIDLRDPALNDEIVHPLQEYQQIRHNNCVRFTSQDGHFMLGYIDGIDVKTHRFFIETPNGTEILDFDGTYDIVDMPHIQPEDEVLQKGNTFRVFDVSAGKYRVYSIKGIDEQNGFVIGHIESLRPSGMALAGAFRYENVEFMGSPETVLQQLPFLRRTYHAYGELTVQFNWEGQILTGKVLTSNTLPAFVEVIIAKDPPPKGHYADHYYRYDVIPEDIIGEVDEIEEE